jgi:hypothetical protein
MSWAACSTAGGGTMNASVVGERWAARTKLPTTVAAVVTNRTLANRRRGRCRPSPLPVAALDEALRHNTLMARRLAAYLQLTAGTVRAAGLPPDRDSFVAHIATVWFEQDHPAYPIIAAAFGDGA